VTNLTNETIGNYRVVRGLGEGGMGTVCLAQHPVIGRKVAIKLLHAELAGHADVVARFFNEARAIHTIGHENIVEILDFGQTERGQPYFIMEFLEGEPLSDTIARGPMDPGRVATIAEQMCRALSAAHSKGIVHRDLKPQNVQLATKPDGGLRVKVLDFGVAKILESQATAGSARTRTGAVMGTPRYMAPEQCRGAGAVDHRADIYSLGVVLFEMLAGRPPFGAEGVGELFTMHMFQTPPQLTAWCPHVPAHLAAAVMKSLAKDPAERFQSMDELCDALTGELELLAERSTDAMTVQETRESAPRKGRWRLLTLVAALVGAVVGFHHAPKAHRAAAPMPAAMAVVPAKVTAEVVRPSGPPVLEAAPSATRVSSVGDRSDGKKRGAPSRRARRLERVVDEDGLATASF